MNMNLKLINVVQPIRSAFVLTVPTKYSSIYLHIEYLYLFALKILACAPLRFFYSVTAAATAALQEEMKALVASIPDGVATFTAIQFVYGVVILFALLCI